MKRIISLIMMLAICAIVCTKAQSRQQVTREEAARVALTCLNRSNTQPIRNRQDLSITERRDSTGNIVLYEVSTDSLSILLSGSRACYPLLAKYYGSILEDYDNLPDNLRWLIDGYIGQIAPCFNNDTARLYYNDDWNNLIDGTNLPPRRTIEYGPLLTTRWDQKGCNIGNEIGYEYYIPTTDLNSCLHCKVGCGAVAMGQVLNYWKHPVSDSWEMKFDWCNMSDRLDVNSPTFIQNREAIANLLKKCADSIHTTYGCEQSTSYVDSIRIALVSDYFQYNSNAMYVQRSSYPDELWMDIIENQIRIGFPVIYSVNASGVGHTFVCDGCAYDDLGRFNISANFGLGDNYFGWFLLDDIHIGNTYFTNSQSAIINIYPFPDDYSILCDRDVILDDYYSLYEDVITNGSHHPWKMLPVTVTNLTSASINSEESWRTIPTGEESHYRAQVSVTLRDGFTAERGSDLAVIISPCDNCGSRDFLLPMSELFAAGSPDNSEAGGLGCYSKKPSPLCEHKVEEVNGEVLFTLKPNPTSGNVIVQISTMTDGNHNILLILHDASGHELRRRVIHDGETHITFTNLLSGVYFVTLRTEEGTSTKKLVVK